MCGIAGGVIGDGGQSVLDAMVAAMRHRGPDDCGVEAAGGRESHAWLGCVRLAILDLSSAGHMPMRDESSGNVIVYNGEVYNFGDLRKELEADGIAFRSRTDTEVVLKAYGRWGLSFLDRLRGMFAIAIWDCRAREFLLARDRLGLKPLYWWQGAGGDILFASEVRALLDSGRVPRRLDVAGLHCYLFNGFLVSPLTLVKDVRSLLPGHWMRVGATGRVIAQGRYWSYPAGPEPGGAPPDAESLRRCLREAVRARMVSDVPLGAFLSGGLDSSTVVGSMAAAGGEVHTFSIVFDEAEFDESAFSRRAAQRFGTRHTEVRLTRETFLAQLPDAVAALDQPSFDGINTYCVSRAAKQSGLTVALSGLGGDELFGGYPFFAWIPRLVGWSRRLSPACRSLRRLTESRLGGLLGVSGPVKCLELSQLDRGADEAERWLAAYQTAQMLFPSWGRRALVAPGAGDIDGALWFGLPGELRALLLREGAGLGSADRLCCYTSRLFMGERCLRDTDAMSMAVSLEVRAPFTDHLWVAQCLRVPGPARCAGPPNKPFQWDLFGGDLGMGLYREAKQGFVFPFRVWLSSPDVAGRLRAALCDRERVECAGLNPEAVVRLLDQHLAGPRRVPWSRVWTLYVLVNWCRQHRVGL